MPKTYNKQTATFLAKVAERMPDIPAGVMQGLLKHPEMLTKALSVLHPWQGQEPQVFGCSLVSMKEARMIDEVRRDIYLAHWGTLAFEAAFAKVPEHAGKVRTVRGTLRHIGLVDGGTLPAIKERAAEFGLGVNPLFVVYQYRLRYRNQPLDEHLYILTDSVDIGEGQSSVFGLTHRLMTPWPPDGTHTNRLLLDGHDGSDEIIWGPDSEWVFALKE